MKRLMTLLAGALCALAVFAGDITADQARTVAENFTTKDAIGKSVLPDRTVDAVVKRGGFYLVTLKPSGHILVSVNRSARPIPVFSGSDFVEPAVGSPQAAFLLAAETNSVNATGTQYETQWKTLLGQRVLRLTTSSTTAYVNIEPMVKSEWSQNYPYNDLMPIINRSTTLVGCVATAYSQILRYWEWPETLNEDIVTEHSVDSMWGHKWRLKAGTVFDWGAMPYSGGYDYATRLKLGRGTMFAGMLARMSYNTAASGAQTARPGQNHWYTPYTCLDTSNSTLEQREERMKQSLKNGCPFMVSVNYGTIGHAVVGDGWQESASGKYVHLNYGWGFSNSYYATNSVVGRFGTFYADPAIVTGSASPDDYANSGYDRGHLAPAADMCFATNTMYESFSMANVSPQLPAFNRGVWKRLEEHVRDIATRERSVYVVTGPVFATNVSPRTIGAHRVRVPDAFYKVLYIESTPVRRYGFLVPHAPSTNALDAFLAPLTNVEQGTGLEFFRTVTNSVCF